MIRDLVTLAPTTCERYFEPFVGAASLFLATTYERCMLSDINGPLIAMYEAVRDRPDLVLTHMRQYEVSHSKEFYLRVRNIQRNSRFAEAARFIYLNRAGYSGIYRVNAKGEYNVPFGPGRTGLAMPSAQRIEALSQSLRDRVSRLSTGDYHQKLASAGYGDFVYLDPPYEKNSATEFFRHYSADRFQGAAALERVVSELTDRGAKVLMTVRATPDAERMFADYHSTVVESAQWLSVRRRAGRLRTQVVMNYAPDPLDDGLLPLATAPR